jgi:hypothetical protein
VFVKPVTASLNTALKLIGDALVGSPCPTAWFIVTVVGFAAITTNAETIPKNANNPNAAILGLRLLTKRPILVSMLPLS